MELNDRLFFPEKICSTNKYEKLLSSFLNVCNVLESQTRNRKAEVESGTESIVMGGKYVIEDLSNLYLTINEACNKIMLTSSCLEKRNAGIEDDSLQIPYYIQSDLVNCLKEVYRVRLRDENIAKANLIKDSTEVSATLQKIIGSNISDLENFECLCNLDSSLSS